MLDEMRVLRDEVEAYRAAATAAGITWPDHGDRNDVPSLDVLCRIFDVDRIAEQPIWLRSEGLPFARILPGGGFPLEWSTDAGEMLGYLSASVAVPFHWRRQLPLFFFNRLVFTFVLSGDHAGEIWRYQADPDDWNPVRAAPSLAALFTQWTKGFAANVYFRSPYDGLLDIGDSEHDPFDVLLERAPDLDPFAFPAYISSFSHEDLLRARQRECGVDVDRVEQYECLEDLLDAVDAAVAALRLTAR